MATGSATTERARTPSSHTDISLSDQTDHVNSKDEDSQNREMSPTEQLDDDIEDDELGNTATRMTSTVSIAEQLPLYREILFVTVLCLAQLFTRKS